MLISDFLSPSDTLIDMRALEKVQFLQEMVHHAATALNLNPTSITAEIMKREQLGSTGVGSGVAIPHARFDSLKKPYGVFARAHKAIPFDAIDRQPVDLIFLLLLSKDRQGEQLNALAAVSRRLRDHAIQRKLRQVNNSGALHRVICDASD